ncbi:MAG TPA: LuxR C-terminal-related transcriptional regulator [Dehalococcoidia bacterium]|nr:LuxR C-terminal-related transcriptional regulator [Dehalococcoidia bacterium]
MRNDTERKEIKFYLNLCYPITMHSDPDGGYVAEIEELPGCMTQAETLDEALKAIEDARQLWIKTAYEEGQDIPLPRDMEEYSGKFIVRIPRSLHRNLVRAAKREGVSLNQYIASLLAAGVQWDIIPSQVQSIPQPQTPEQILQRVEELSKESGSATFISPLTPRESEILNYVAQGYLNKEIAELLGTSEQAIKNHINSILRKLNANSRTQAVWAALIRAGKYDKIRMEGDVHLKGSKCIE